MDDEFKGHYETYRSRHNKQWRWRLRARNNKIIAAAGESYHNEADCIHGINLVKSTTTETKIIRAKR